MATELILVEVELPFGGIPTVKDPCFAPIRVFLERISWIWRNEESVVVVLELDRVAAQLIECCDGRLETQLAEFHSSTASLFSFPHRTPSHAVRGVGGRFRYGAGARVKERTSERASEKEAIIALERESVGRSVRRSACKSERVRERERARVSAGEGECLSATGR